MKRSTSKTIRHSRGLIKNVPYILLGVLIVFAIAALVAGELLGAYKSFWWWDDMLHTISGVIVGLVGFLMVYFFNARYNMAISPLFIAVFAFAFATVIAVGWEIFEFTMDALFRANMQRWSQPDTVWLIGREYQGDGLRDTISDLIVGWVGALFASVFAYLAYKHEKPAVLRAMRHTFPWKKPRR